MQKRKITFYLRAATSVGVIHLPCVREESTVFYLRLRFDWIVFERDLTLHSIQLRAELTTKAGITDYELGDETPVGKNQKVHWMPARKHSRFMSVVPLKFIRELDPSYTPAKP